MPPERPTKTHLYIAPAWFLVDLFSAGQQTDGLVHTRRKTAGPHARRRAVVTDAKPRRRAPLDRYSRSAAASAVVAVVAAEAALVAS